MPSMLEVMREYKHLSARKRAEGRLPPSLEERLAELEGVVKASVKKEDSQENIPVPSAVPRPRASSAMDAQTPAPQSRPRPSTQSQSSMPAMTPRPPPPSVSSAQAPANGMSHHSSGAHPAQAAVQTPTPPKISIASIPTKVGEVARSVAETTTNPMGAFEAVAARLPDDTLKRIFVVIGITMTLLAICILLAVAAGLPAVQARGTLLPPLFLIGGTGWFLIYPALMLWRESAAASGTGHINEPDFEAKIPVMEPVAAALSALGIVLWVWLGGYTTQGIGYVAGVLVGMLLGMVTMGFGAAFVLRPIISKKVKARALRQYLEGGTYHLNKGNPKRARRLLERAMDEAIGSQQQNEIGKLLKKAAMEEADELRKKGHTQKADEIISQMSSRQGMELSTGWAGAQQVKSIDIPREDTNENVTANELLTQGPKPPMLLSHGEVMIDDGSPRKPTADEPAIRERARILERRGRIREAFEMFITGRLPATRSMAQEAIKQYIAQGMLRSAEVVFDALGELQSPEFYQAVAAEWAKDSMGDPPPEQCTRLARKLLQLNALEPAARVACRGALSKAGTREEKRGALELSLHLCKQLGMEPPVEILEEMGEFAAAAKAYDQEGRQPEALRCYKKAADDLLSKKAEPAKLIPVLSKIFILDPEQPQQYLEPLAQHVLDTNASGPSSLKILLAYKKKKKEDERLNKKLFQLFVELQQGEDAWRELELIAKNPNAAPEAQLKDFRMFVDRFADNLKARSQYVRLLLKVGRIEDAAAQVHQFLGRNGDKNDPEEAIGLLETLLDWGHDDNELRKSLGLLRISRGKTDEGLQDLERYAHEGGRDPLALKTARDMLSEKLALENGSPNHARLFRLGKFLLSSGDPEASVQHLEVGRGGKEQRAQADLLLARAYVGVGNAKKAIALLNKSIAQRPLEQTLELHYELARAQEAAGVYAEARRIDKAIAQADPHFAAEYEKSRGRGDRADTAWAPESVDPQPQIPGDTTDATVAPPLEERQQQERVSEKSVERKLTKPPSPSPAPRAAPPRESSSVSPSNPISLNSPSGLEDMGANLGEALLPRYRLLRKLGAGGMGEVHLAEDTDLGRYVAIKVLRRSLANDLFLLKFKEEARIVAQLAHPNIVQIYDLGQRGNYSYIVMEYVDGPDLASLINKSNGFERKRLLRIVAMVADAMDYAHTRGVIHRDLKPANILVGPNDVAKVTDFGIAKVLQPDGNETAFSAAGLQVGTVNYMAPEQISAKNVDARTDIYLLATTLYVCLTGSFPYSGDAVVYQKLREDPTPLRKYVSSISTDLEAVVMKCLARKPEARYQRMAELAEALRKVLEKRV